MSASILAFAGSNRTGSLNRRALAAAVRVAREAGGEVTEIDLRDYPMPIYDGDLEASEGVPPAARALREVFRRHQGLLIASPEYNGGISPLLKNTLDWLSRELDGEPGTVPYRGKVAALVSASPGPFGGLRALPMVRQVLSMLGVIVLPGQAAIATASEAFDADGTLRNPRQRAMLDSTVRELVRVVGKLA